MSKVRILMLRVVIANHYIIYKNLTETLYSTVAGELSSLALARVSVPLVKPWPIPEAIED